MTTCGKWPVGICSWSLQQDIEQIVGSLQELTLDHIHLAVGPALESDGQRYLDVIRAQTWTVSATMIGFDQEDYSTLESIKATGGIGPDEHWAQNRDIVCRAIDLTAELGVKYLAFHAGFIDHTQPALVKTFYERMKILADAAAEKQIMLLMETGQETAEELVQFLKEINHPALGVNFDPANMILYDKGDPIEALRTLGPWIKHLHVKDATRTQTPGAWGVEVPWGQGEVPHETFLNTLKEIDYAGTLAIEREAGDDRLGDIRLAVEALSRYTL